ncbi:MAG TPA: hypothetical protein H9761_05745 [Candidatus Eisenbergiella merdavium]|uniref:Uncharacterized protein n=1 Tax=Candidatus Eisenbergiella merdavium TaxID=2838551 RepID=A0A9D2SQ79_9FIRM|nr:hypothetical protein [Candidatus Eisenbergiella merdavium]
MRLKHVHIDSPNMKDSPGLPGDWYYGCPFHWPLEKKGVMYAIMNPMLLRIAQEITILLSQARDSSTVRPDLEKFIKSRAAEAVTMAAIVEIPRI